MRDYRHAKAMARSLRAALAEKHIRITHADALELVARQFGFDDWNILAARIAVEPPAGARAAPELEPGLIPVLPVRDVVVFPGAALPLFVGRERSKAAVRHALAGDRRLLLVTQRRMEDEAPLAEDLHRVGVRAEVLQAMTLPDGAIKLLVQGGERAMISGWRAEGDCLAARAAALPQAAMPAEAATLVAALREGFQAFAKVDPQRPPQALLPLMALADPRNAAHSAGAFADILAQHLSLSLKDRQELLEMVDPADRLRRLLELIPPADQAA